jgi:hypothetical protein
MTFAAFWAGITALFAALPELIKLFKGSATGKIEDKKSDIDEERRKQQETGRPTWS